jgi:hypothetical protein
VIFFDLETVTDKETQELIIDLAIAIMSCEQCRYRKGEEKCENCGIPCKSCIRKKSNTCNEASCMSRQIIFDDGPSTGPLFFKWLINKTHYNHRIAAFNGSNFDFRYLVQMGVENGVIPKVIYRGPRILSLRFPALKISSADPYCFFLCSLKNAAKMFNLDLRKGYYPHFCDINMDYKNLIPPPECFGVQDMKEYDLKEFYAWYNSRKQTPYKLREERILYCIDDVKILQASYSKFDDLIRGLSGHQTENGVTGGLDAFSYISIASLTSALFKHKYLQEQYLVLTKQDIQSAAGGEISPAYNPGVLQWGQMKVWSPESDTTKKVHDDDIVDRKFIKSDLLNIPRHKYANRDTFSKECLEWVKWIEFQYGVQCHTALSPGGEIRVPSPRGSCYKLDALFSIGTDLYAAEYLGCHTHGHVTCTTNSTGGFLGKKITPGERLAKTNRRREDLESLGFRTLEIWACEWNMLKKSNRMAAQIAQSLDLNPFLQPDMALYGGRVECFRLYTDVADSPLKYINYVDVVSLYPFVMSTYPMPMGPPTIIREHFRPLVKGQLPYIGLIFCKVLFPATQKLHIPVLPFRCPKTRCLLFPLCAKCAIDRNQGVCMCSPDERAITGVYCVEEVNLCLRHGYKLVQIYEVWDFTETGKIYTDFIRSIFSIKLQATGFPEGVQTDLDRERYVTLCRKNGYDVETERFRRDSSLRGIAKIILNSAYGRLCLRSNQCQTQFITRLDEIYDILHDDRKQVMDYQIVTDHVAWIQWCHRFSSDVPVPDNVNIILAAHITCFARIHLYKMLTASSDPIYADTDSLCYLNHGADPPKELEVSTTNFLGELQSELSCAKLGCTELHPSGHSIKRLIALAPKSYSYQVGTAGRIDNNESLVERTVAKGFSLTSRNAKILNFQSMKSVLDDPTLRLETYHEHRLSHDKVRSKIYARSESRTFSYVFNKRIVLDNYHTVPYGYYTTSN